MGFENDIEHIATPRLTAATITRSILKTFSEPSASDKSALLCLYDNLKEALQYEETLSHLTIMESLDAFKRGLESGDMTKAGTAIKLLHEYLEPFSVEDYDELLEEGRRAAVELDSKEGVILIGPTGAGKSTTIHHLAGSTLTRDEGHYFIYPSEVRNRTIKERQSVILSRDVTKSCTRFLAAVPVMLSDIPGCDIRKEIVLIDAPGYGDLSGAEMDVANTKNVIDSMQRLRSVKILVLISKKTIGNRLEGLLELCALLNGMLRNVAQHLQSIMVGFTGWNRSEAVELQTLLKEGLNYIKSMPFSKRPSNWYVVFV